MRLDPHEALARLASQDHAVLCTLHPERGADAVPVAFAVVDGLVGIPVDLVKPKASTRLQREANLAADPRATLLAEGWNAVDWSQLWWVRAELRWESDPDAHQTAALAAELLARYPQYREVAEPFERVLVLRIIGLTGWAASG